MTTNEPDSATAASTLAAESTSESSSTGGRRAKPSRRAKQPKEKRKQLPVWQETILLLGVALVLAIVIKAFFVQAFYIPSESMEPGLIKNDRILVQKPAYWGSKGPSRGDVVVFKDPGGWLNEAETAGPTSLLAKALERIGLYPSGGHLVKRVIGVEGDTIVCCDKQGRIKVNGVALDDESFTKNLKDCQGPMTGCKWKAGPVPEGELFVMGDHRDNSADSTVHRCRKGDTECVPGNEYVPVDLVVGKVFALVWPSSRFSWVKRPDAFEDIPDPA
ncbi:signal peptidase I [Nocardioides speluncae]|uniref:signal peptidase I n=1 Tax=Nocardioides speluncae TaxID=2670337 RepID=UPI001F0B9BE8|nr:signal peptidase I [Nocardioides speluncae]